MCIVVRTLEASQRRERPLDGKKAGDDLHGLGRPLVGIGPPGDLVEVVPDARRLPRALALHFGVRHGPGARPAERPAHQIRQRWIPSAVGFILALRLWWASPPADALEPCRQNRLLYNQGTDFDRVNYARIGDVLGVPASSHSRIGLRQRHLRRHSEASHAAQTSPTTVALIGAV